MNQTHAAPPVHVFFVLDRSGSMECVRSDVIGGFNRFIKDQQRDASECRLTLVQFDSHDPHEVVFDSLPIAEVPALDENSFVPRSGTPLYDAMGHTIADAAIRGEKRKAGGEAEEQILFVTFTDGEENSSCEYDRCKIFDLIKKREESGWTFAYLGANQDAYAEGGRMGYGRGGTQNYRSDRVGTALAFDSASRAVRSRRSRIAQGEDVSAEGLFEGFKEADEDARKRD